MERETTWCSSTQQRSCSRLSEATSSSSTSLVSLAYDPVIVGERRRIDDSRCITPALYNCLPGIHSSRRRSAPVANPSVLSAVPDLHSIHGETSKYWSNVVPQPATRGCLFPSSDRGDTCRRFPSLSSQNRWTSSTRCCSGHNLHACRADRVRPVSSSPCSTPFRFAGHHSIAAVSHLYTNSVRAELQDLSALIQELFPLRTDRSTRLFAQWWSFFACYVNAIFDVVDRNLLVECCKGLKSFRRSASDTTSASFETCTMPNIQGEVEISRDLLADVNSKLNRLELFSESLRENNMYELVVFSFEDSLRDAVIHLDALLGIVDREITAALLRAPPDAHALYCLHSDCANTILAQDTFKSYRGWCGIAILLRWIQDKKVVDAYLKNYMKGRRWFLARKALRTTERQHFAIVLFAKTGRRQARASFMFH